MVALSFLQVCGSRAMLSWDNVLRISGCNAMSCNALVLDLHPRFVSWANCVPDDMIRAWLAVHPHLLVDACHES
jgi:hypothetical protein